MPAPTIIAALLILVGGALITLQAPINAALGRTIGSSVAAATVSFGIGFAVLLVITFFIGDRAALANAAQVPRYLLIGGLLGAVYVWSALWAVPILGVLTTAMLLILGQMAASLALDHFGAFGLAQKDISPQRLVAAGLVAAGAWLSRA